MIATLFALRILEGKETFNDVPVKLKTEVSGLLIEKYERLDLVPVLYGGTLE